MMYNDFVVAMSVISEIKQSKKAKILEAQHNVAMMLQDSTTSRRSPSRANSLVLENEEEAKELEALIKPVSLDPLMDSLHATMDGFADIATEFEKVKIDLFLESRIKIWMLTDRCKNVMLDLLILIGPKRP